MASDEALYGRRCKTRLCWQEIDDALTIRLELIQVATQKIRIIKEWMKAAQSGQNIYAYRRCRPLEFEVRD